MNATRLKAERYITDGRGKQLGVLLDLKTYARLREAEEELADIRAYDAARPKALREVQMGQFATLAEFEAKRGRKAR